ncbi:exonuclease 1 [Harmonia axyridis]|uniref:exonuclease 1 n=1 Tax=Harmonia axyridis TaxID=115357 RepID=UPI001E2796DF|nr:exonuclease 1 [Harmonia axyridis]
MGITGLLPFLEKATRNCNVSEFRGATVAIDSYCWLHKGATACADILARGEETDIYVNYCMKYLNMLKKYDIKPIMVFDGNHLPAKALTEKRRRETRKNAKVRAAELLRLGKKDEAWNYFRQSIDITAAMALNLIKECRRNNIDCIVAPYESDSQLAFLNIKRIADIVITEDSDLVLFGCDKILYKMDINGNGRLVDKQKLPLCMDMKPDKYTFDKFRYMCILSGCDYLDSLPGIGLKKALKFISLTAETNPVKFLDKLPRYLNMKNLVVTEDYKTNFLIAEATFKHQVVFDPLQRKLTYLTDPALCGTRPEHCKNAGEFFDEKTAYQVAIGNLNPFSHEKYDDWSPTKNWNNSFHSIWSNTYIKKKSRVEQKQLERSENIEVKEKQMKEIVRKNEEIDQEEKVHTEKFESELNIYYQKETKKLSHCKNEDKINESLGKEDSEDEEKLSDKPKDSTSCHEQSVKKEESPTLPRKSVNPFLKKRLSKFGSTEVKTDVVVKSKYFHSKSVDLGIVKKEEQKTDDDICSLETIEVEEDREHSKKRKTEPEEETCIIDESPVKDEEKTKISCSQPTSSTAKKPKLSRCRSVGLPVKSKKFQPTLQAFFGNLKKS